MNENSIQSGGVFEITDYTTASDWERFIAGLEETLTQWNLHKQTNNEGSYQELAAGFISNGIWIERHDTIKFGNVVFEVKYQYMDKSDDEKAIKKRDENDEGDHGDRIPDCVGDLMSTSNDFASKAHCLVRWYNLRRFLILVPRADTIISEDKVKLLLSSASVALANIDCHVPIFVQIHNPKNHFYQGISEHANLRTMYEMVFFKKSMKQYSYLSDLIAMFREKANCDLSDDIFSTIRLNYCLDIFDLFIEPPEEFSGNEYLDDEQDELVKMTKNPVRPQMQDMRSGASFEQVTEALKDCLPHPYKILKYIHVAALWPPVSDKVITDSQVHSDLDPAEAPLWTMRCVTKDNCNMKQVHETQAVYDLLCSAINYSFDKLDGSQVFSDIDREDLKSRCLELSYDLACKPEVLLSDKPSDAMRKLVALLFYRAAEMTAEQDALDQIAGQLKRKPSLNEVYRCFSKKIKPSVREFIIRAQVPRPFRASSSPPLAQRMFCTICDGEFRLCGAFTELCN